MFALCEKMQNHSPGSMWSFVDNKDLASHELKKTTNKNHHLSWFLQTEQRLTMHFSVHLNIYFIP